MDRYQEYLQTWLEAPEVLDRAAAGAAMRNVSRAVTAARITELGRKESLALPAGVPLGRVGFTRQDMRMNHVLRICAELVTGYRLEHSTPREQAWAARTLFGFQPPDVLIGWMRGGTRRV